MNGVKGQRRRFSLPLLGQQLIALAVAVFFIFPLLIILNNAFKTV